MPTATASRRDRLTEHAAEEGWMDLGQYDSTFVSDVESELDGLSRLKKNWDGYGAPPIDRKIIEAARQFVRRLPPITDMRPHVVPMSAGNLQFEWDNGPKSLELEFENPRVIHFLQWNPEGGVEEESTFPATETDRAGDLLRWLISGN
jgi:hypothetical protein